MERPYGHRSEFGHLCWSLRRPLAEPEPKTTSQNTSRYAPMKKLAIVPGRKPRYVEQFNIENYLLDGERAPRWTNGEIPSILSESDVSRYRVIFRVQQEGDWHLADKIIRSIDNHPNGACLGPTLPAPNKISVQLRRTEIVDGFLC